MIDLIIRWRLNRALLASKMEMPKGTFNNKLSPSHATKFSPDEWQKLKCVLIDLRTELQEIDDIEFNEALQIIAQQEIA